MRGWGVWIFSGTTQYRLCCSFSFLESNNGLVLLLEDDEVDDEDDGDEDEDDEEGEGKCKIFGV